MSKIRIKTAKILLKGAHKLLGVSMTCGVIYVDGERIKL